jgi:thiamine pyrophosphokinase
MGSLFLPFCYEVDAVESKHFVICSCSLKGGRADDILEEISRLATELASRCAVSSLSRDREVLWPRKDKFDGSKGAPTIANDCL